MQLKPTRKCYNSIDLSQLFKKIDSEIALKKNKDTVPLKLFLHVIHTSSCRLHKDTIGHGSNKIDPLLLLFMINVNLTLKKTHYLNTSKN